MVAGPPPVITTERLALPLWGPGEVAAIRGGIRPPAGHRVQWHPDFPRPEDVDAASLWREGDPWGPRSIVRGVTVLGSVGFFGAPAPGPDDVPEVEIGYGLVTEARGWGFATEAVRAVLAECDALGVRAWASVAAGNAAGLRVLARCGFTQLRGTGEDDELVMVRPRPGVVA